MRTLVLALALALLTLAACDDGLDDEITNPVWTPGNAVCEPRPDGSGFNCTVRP